MRIINNVWTVLFPLLLLYLFIRGVVSGDVPATPICIGIPLFLIGCLVFLGWFRRRTDDSRF